ncbi:low affinity immunoglobulin epsilon Fc receptor-like [Mustelus asterias]
MDIQMMKEQLLELDGKFQNLSEIARSLCRFLRNCSEFHCPSGWKMYNQSCYRFSTELKNWVSANQECESLNSQLIIINSKQKQDLIINSSEFKESDYWIGLRDTKRDGNFTWVDGTPLRYPAWARGEPNHWGIENCAALRSVGSRCVCKTCSSDAGKAG